MDAAALRAEFPVFDRYAYLNAGTDGPVPRAAATAATEVIERATSEGRWTAHFERRAELTASLRAFYAALLGAAEADVALTTSTTDGIAVALAAFPLARGDEILTSDDEHPGLLGPLRAARDARGARIRFAPFGELAAAIGPQTRLVACSHVSWIDGRFADVAEIAAAGVPLLLDGAQGLGAVPVDVRALGCAIYAASGQKWLCGPDGSGALYLSPAIRERLALVRPCYTSFADHEGGLEAALHDDARVHDTPALAAETLAFAAASLDVLGRAGWDWIHERAATLADRLVAELRARGFAVAPRGRSTLVSFGVADAVAERDRLARAQIIVRNLPERDLLRVSTGAWNDERDIERLLEALAPAPGGG